ncbi:MAG: TPR end-of-group domain-containing protein, partial [Candidatus Acidiferrales bacterium]
AGDKQRALDWLETAYEQRDSWLTFLKDDLRFLSLHDEPRFQALLRRMRIPQ